MPLPDHAPAIDALLPIELVALRKPDAIALTALGRDPLTYVELERQVETLRGLLLDAGMRTSGVVALAMPSGPEFIKAFLACASVGACAPLDPALTEPECRFHLSRLRAQALISERGTTAAAAATALGMEVLTLRLAPGDAAGISPTGGAVLAGRSTDAAVLLHTSATTDTPKLVPLTRANLRAMAMHDVRALQLTANDRMLSLMPLYHLHGISSVMAQLACGGTVISTAGFDAENFLGWLAEFRPTWFSSTPAIQRVILALAREQPDRFRAAPLRLIRSTGAGLDAAVPAALEDATGVPVLEGYGLTETGGVARNTLLCRRAGSVGRSSGAEIRIIDPSGTPLPRGMEGEIAVRGPSVSSGYLEDDDATQSAFQDGWFHTGDLGHLDDDGFLFLSGRRKEIINRGGQKIVPGEVDRALAAHPAVADAAAFALPHRTLDEDVAAAVALRPGATATELDLRQFAATRLAAFKCPRRIVFVDRIPRGPTGKPKRSQLTEQFSERVTHPEPAEFDSVGQSLAAIWRRLLGVDSFDPEDDFFCLGGDSLTCAMMLAEVCRTFQLNPECFPVLDFFDQATVATLARAIAAAQPGSHGDGCIALRTSGSRPPLFCIPASNHGPYYLRHLAKGLGCEQPFFVVCPATPPNGLCSIEDAARLAVNAIRSVRPQGPYVVAGHCHGGVVAFEAARQLITQGERVVCLVLFDTPTPGYPKIRRHWRRYAAVAYEMASQLARGRRPISAAETAAHLQMLKRIVSRRFAGRAAVAVSAVDAGALKTGPPQDSLKGLAMRGYSPRDVSARIVQFIATDRPASTKLLDDARLGWRDFARAGFEERRVKGDHNSMFEPSHAGALAEHLHTILGSQR